MTKVLIVEDHALVREALAHTLMRIEPRLQCVEATDSEQALKLLEQGDDWDLAVVDLMLPDVNGFSLLGVLARRFPDVPAVVVSALDDPASLRRAMRAGASGFVPKASSGAELREAITAVLDGDVYVPASLRDDRPEEVGKKTSVAERYGLTAAQMRVVEVLRQGKTNREIAEFLGLSEGTVKIHVSAILRALNVRNRAQALVLLNDERRLH